MLYILNDTDMDYFIEKTKLDLQSRICIFVKNTTQLTFSGKNVIALLKYAMDKEHPVDIEIIEAESKEEQLFLIGSMVSNTEENMIIYNIPVIIPSKYKDRVEKIEIAAVKDEVKPKRKRRTKAEMEKEHMQNAQQEAEPDQKKNKKSDVVPSSLSEKKNDITKEENAGQKEENRSMKEILLEHQKKREAEKKTEQMDAEEKRRLEFEKRKAERKATEQQESELIPTETEEEIVNSLEENELNVYKLLKVKSSDIGYTWPTNMLIYNIISMANDAVDINEFEQAIKFANHGNKLWKICKPHIKELWEMLKNVA